MEKKPSVRQRQSLMEMMRRQRRDPSGDLPFDPDEEEDMEDEEDR